MNPDQISGCRATTPARWHRLAHALALTALSTALLGRTPPGEPEEHPAPAATTPRGDTVLVRGVLAILQSRCLACHGEDPEDLGGGFDLRTREGMLRGGDSGDSALRPGEPAASLLLTAVTWSDPRLRMPPKESARLSPGEIELVRSWIAAGAPWTRPGESGAERDGVRVPTGGGQTVEWTERTYRPEDLWSYRPLRRPRVPVEALPADGPAHPIDAFVARRLRERGLSAAPPADRRTLLRRLTHVLTGLPPSPAEVDSFLGDGCAGAYERVVDRLLASPRHGERMAQHWLDVVRYADTDGFANDFERPHAWRYRDYVIRAFNDDKPFDRFVIEQIAGDELGPHKAETLVATGFLRMGPWEHTGMSVEAVTRQLFLDDVTNSVGVTFLGQELRCARCHDHKFDPIPTRDYYRVQAVFSSTRFAEREAPFQARESIPHVERRRARIEALTDADGLSGEPGERNDTLERIRRKRQQYLGRARRRFEPVAFAVKTAPAEATHILQRGSLEAPGEEVAPGVLSAIPIDNERPKAPEIPRSPSGRRLALARWIASPDNPLTARVIVNRIWQVHFGKGLVATPNNLGKTGRRPTHPELLDWLASWFVDGGWSLKKLHRLIVTSETFQRSARHPDPRALRSADPDNELLARFPPRRLSAEEIRDGALALSGELVETMGGPGIFPEINWEAALQPRHIMGGIAPAYQPSPEPEQRHRRTIYAFRHRTLANPLLEIWNRPGSDVSCERRDETTVTPQVFALFNGQFAHDRALALARRLEARADDLPARIELAFRLVYPRQPTPGQLERCLDHVREMTRHHREHRPPPVKLPTTVERETIAEQTGELFHWQERLELMEQFRADLKPRDVDPGTRALAELCLVLLNSNEFLYVY